MKVATGVLIIAIIVAAGWIIAVHHNQTLHINGRVISLEVAKTEKQREKGLSGRDSLPQDWGMLFVFDHPSKYCFWMKDTRIPLDMIWLNQQKRVFYIQQDVQPNSYPASFCPDQAASYVIELNAGQAAKLNISLAAQLSF